MPLPIPTLETERLRLVAPEERHLEAEIPFWESERSRFVGGPVPGYRVWRLLATQLGHWALRGYGSWVVEEKASGRPLGMVGLWHPGEWPEPELAYHLYEGSEGKGYASEAGRAVIGHAYGTLGWRTLISLIDPENAPSQAVARRLGAVNTGETFVSNPADPACRPVEIWRYPGPEARA